MKSPERYRVISLGICLVAFLSAAPAMLAQPAELPRGVVIERVACEADAQQSYALYLPSNYTPQTKWPVIYAFDPGALGRIPVDRFKDAAEKYGYIIAGSNNTQNGMAAASLQAAVTSMVSDTRRRLSIEERRIYTSGFSGGARIATRVAASCGGCVAGVIVCGAGFPADIAPTSDTPFILFGTVGIDDYNYPELTRLDEKLGMLKIPHRIATFTGGHEWASAGLLVEAVEWMEIQAMRSGRRAREEALIEAVWNRDLERARADETAQRLFDAYIGYASLVEDFKDLRDVSKAKQKALYLREKKEVTDATKQRHEQVQKQLDLAAELIDLGAKLLTEPHERTKTRKDLKSRIEVLRKGAGASQDSVERRVARRALRQVFAQTVEAAMFNYHPRRQYELAVVNLEVAEEIAPANWKVTFEMARSYALNGDKKKAIESLQRAVRKGLAQLSTIESQRDFDSLRTHPEYRSVIQQIKLQN